MSRITLELAVLVIAVSAIHAQVNQKNEIGLLLGAVVTPSLNEEGGANLRVGSGIAFQLTYARLLSSDSRIRLYFEVPALAIPLQDIRSPNGDIPLNYDSLFVTPSLRAKFRPESTLSPWMSAGGGYALFDESASRNDGTHNTTRGTSGGALQFGGGLDVRTRLKFLIPIGARLEVRDFYTQKPNYNVDTGGGFQHNLVFSGGLVLHF